MNSEMMHVFPYLFVVLELHRFLTHGYLFTHGDHQWNNVVFAVLEGMRRPVVSPTCLARLEVHQLLAAVVTPCGLLAVCTTFKVIKVWSHAASACPTTVRTKHFAMQYVELKVCNQMRVHETKQKRQARLQTRVSMQHVELQVCHQMRVPETKQE